jgi:hypothetical protein
MSSTDTDRGNVRARWDVEASRLSIEVAGRAGCGDARPVRAFPASAPDEMIELSDAKGEPIGVLRRLDELDAGSRAAVEAAFRARYLTPRIERVAELTEVAPFVLRWRVGTDRGERLFYTESSREAVRPQPGEGLRVTDLAGDQYELPAPSRLDPASRALLAAVL